MSLSSEFDWMLPRRYWKLAALILTTVLTLPWVGCYQCSKVQVADGYRDSTVRKLSETGVFYKTWEAESLGDGLRATDNQNGDRTISPETFQYSVRDPAVIERLRNLRPGERVRIHYVKYLAAWSPNGESRYIITGIEPVPPTEGKP